MKTTRTLLTTALLVLSVGSLSAQILVPGSALIAHVEGKVYLDQERVEPSSAPIFILNPNSAVRTEDGRAEIRLAGGVYLFLGQNAAAKRVPSSPYNFSRFEMLSGSAVVSTGEMSSVATCSNEVTLSDSGLYRFDVILLPELPTNEKLCGLRVYEGAAAVKLETVVSVVTAGKSTGLNLRCGDRTTLPQKFDPEHTDALYDWSRQRIRLRSTQSLIIPLFKLTHYSPV